MFIRLFRLITSESGLISFTCFSPFDFWSCYFFRDLTFECLGFSQKGGWQKLQNKLLTLDLRTKKCKLGNISKFNCSLILLVWCWESPEGRRVVGAGRWSVGMRSSRCDEEAPWHALALTQVHKQGRRGKQQLLSFLATMHAWVEQPAQKSLNSSIHERHKAKS